MDEYIPMNKWSKDHWSTLAYLETVMVDAGGFQVGSDPRMRSNRRHFRVMHQECPKPKRPTKDWALGVVMDASHGTVLKDGSSVANHDDWMCVQDMAAEGLFTTDVDGVQPGETLHLSARGLALAAALRAHKAAGGTFASFDASSVPAPIPA